MPHPRQVIRDAVIARLKADAGIIAAKHPVETARGFDLPSVDLPRIMVATAGDERLGDEPRSVSPVVYQRNCLIRIECVRSWEHRDWTYPQ